MEKYLAHFGKGAGAAATFTYNVLLLFGPVLAAALVAALAGFGLGGIAGLTVGAVFLLAGAKVLNVHPHGLDSVNGLLGGAIGILYGLFLIAGVNVIGGALTGSAGGVAVVPLAAIPVGLGLLAFAGKSHSTQI